MAGRAALLLLLATSLIAVARSELVVEALHRKIDISGFKAVYQAALTFRNDGKSAESSVLLCEHASLMEHVATMEVASAAGGDVNQLTKLAWREAVPPPAGAAEAGLTCREYQLKEALKTGDKAMLQLAGVFTHVLRPEPAKIRQNEPQRVLFRGDALFPSLYKVESQATEIMLGTSNVPSFTQVKPSKRSGNSLHYGPYENTDPFASKPINVHYENMAPFACVTELEREIEVSHWGNVYFEERYSLKHAGAKIVGEWSRFDLMTKPQEYARGAIAQVTAALPPSAHSLYYRDGIGNISSSDTHFTPEAVAVSLVPRYPLFGGWSIKFLFGWSLPLKDAVIKDKGRYVLTTLLGPAVREMVVDRMTVKVVLPEGAKDPKIDTEIKPASEPSIETKYTYLDVMGRLVVVLRFNNVVPEMNAPLRIEYSYSSLGLLQKPVLLVAGFGVLFLAAIVLNRSSSTLGSSANLVAKAKAS